HRRRGRPAAARAGADARVARARAGQRLHCGPGTRCGGHLRAHGGLRLVSEPAGHARSARRGTTLRVTMPTARADSPLVLIVDDDEAVRASLTLLLKQSGFRSHAVAGPDAALAWLAGHSCLLVLQDMNFSR